MYISILIFIYNLFVIICCDCETFVLHLRYKYYKHTLNTWRATRTTGIENMTNTTTTPSIYVGTYAKYNNGSIEGQWLDLTKYSDYDEFMEACKELHADEADPEFMFQDYEGIPEAFISESHIDENFWEFMEVLEKIENMDDSELVGLHNEYCQNNSLYDDEIFSNDDEFFETYFSGKVVKAVRAAVYGDYNFSHDYVTFDGYANLKSFDNPLEYIDKTVIINDIIENRSNYSI